MLDQMRQQAQSTIIIILFGFIIFVFVFSFGAGSVGFRTGGCGRSGVAAMVNGEDIPEHDLEFAYEQQVAYRLQSRRDSKPLTIEEKKTLRREVLESLVDQILLLQAARNLGLHVTDQERNADIREKFTDRKEGRFDLKQYTMIVQRHYKTSLPLFEENWRQRMLADRMREIISATAVVTDDELEQAFRTRETKVNLEFVTVPAASYKDTIQVADADAEGFLKDHNDRVQAAYSGQHTRFHKPRKIKVAHVFFEVRTEFDTEQVNDRKERAGFTLEDLKKGAEFAQQAKEYSHDQASREKGGELTLMDKEALTARWGAAFADAAMALREGELSGVVQGEKGFHVIKSLQIVEAEDHPFDEVKLTLARELLIEERADQAAKAEAERLLAKVREGKKLEELLPQDDPSAKLKVGHTGMISRTGGFIPQIGLNEELARAVFDLTKEKPVPESIFTIDSPDGMPSYVVVRLTDRADPDMEAFEKAKKELRDRMLMEREMRQVRAWLNYERKIAEVQVNEALLDDVTPPGMRRQAPIQDDY